MYEDVQIEIDVNIDNLFNYFLKQNNCLKEYNANIRVYRDSKKIKCFFRHTHPITKYNPHRWIINAFKWGSTPEGVFFWSEIHDKWFNFFEKEYLNNTSKLRRIK